MIPFLWPAGPSTGVALILWRIRTRRGSGRWWRRGRGRRSVMLFSFAGNYCDIPTIHKINGEECISNACTGSHSQMQVGHVAGQDHSVSGRVIEQPPDDVTPHVSWRSDCGVCRWLDYKSNISIEVVRCARGGLDILSLRCGSNRPFHRPSLYARQSPAQTASQSASGWLSTFLRLFNQKTNSCQITILAHYLVVSGVADTLVYIFGGLDPSCKENKGTLYKLAVEVGFWGRIPFCDRRSGNPV